MEREAGGERVVTWAALRLLLLYQIVGMKISFSFIFFHFSKWVAYGIVIQYNLQPSVARVPVWHLGKGGKVSLTAGQSLNTRSLFEERVENDQ